jgi:hypothetical protein
LGHWRPSPGSAAPFPLCRGRRAIIIFQRYITPDRSRAKERRHFADYFARDASSARPTMVTNATSNSGFSRYTVPATKLLYRRRSKGKKAQNEGFDGAVQRKHDPFFAELLRINSEILLRREAVAAAEYSFRTEINIAREREGAD